MAHMNQYRNWSTGKPPIMPPGWMLLLGLFCLIGGLLALGVVFYYGLSLQDDSTACGKLLGLGSGGLVGGLLLLYQASRWWGRWPPTSR
jgi:hypothetical protein